jgi:hypothetical protein
MVVVVARQRSARSKLNGLECFAMLVTIRMRTILAL